MRIITALANTAEDFIAIERIRQQVFEREMGIKLDPLLASENGHATYLVARVGPDKEPAGALCVLDTTGNNEIHESLGLKFEPEARVARFTHLAVLKPYRGMKIPLAMMLEAHRRVIVPDRFDYTWLLFDVERAANSFLSRLLGFTLLPQIFVSEYGRRCPLVRDENAPQEQQLMDQAETYLRQCEDIACAYQ